MSANLDDSANRHLLKRLEELGLHEKEARVYIALLPYRDIGSSTIIRATGLHGQFVYDSLEKLQEMGLAKHVIQNGRKKFSANSPKRILSMLEERKVSAQSVVQQLQERFVGAHEQDFEVYQGETAFMAHQLELLKNVSNGSVVDVIGSENETYSTTFKETGMWDEFQKIWREKKIGFRYLGTAAQREWLQWREKNEPRFEYRILPGMSIGKISIEVRPDNVTFAVYSPALLDFTLTSKEVADGYREFFNAIWNLSVK